MIRSILVATDFSPAADAAVTQAARLATRLNAALHVLHAPSNDLNDELAAFFPDTKDYGVQSATDAIRERIAASLAAIDAPKNAEILVQPGNAFKEILTAIEKTGADLLVLGSTGETGAKLGTVGGKCVRKAPIDTLLVPAGGKAPFDHITACVDFSELSPQVIKSAAGIARADSGSLTALYAHEKVDQSVFCKGPPQELIDKLPGVIEQRFASELAPLAGETPVSFTMTVCRSYSEGIVRHAADSGTSLVALGTTGRSGIAYLLLGTTAEKVIREVGCAVLAVKPRKS